VSLPALVLLAAALAAAPAREAPAFHLGGVPVQVQLEVVAEPAAPSPPFEWRRVGDGLVGVAADARLQATVRVAPAAAAAATLSFEVAWRVAAEVEREAIHLVVPGRGAAVHRDLELRPLRAPLRVDRGTPIAVVAGDLAVVGEEGFVAARAAPVRIAGDGEAVEVTLVRDDAGAHPFAVYPTCLERIPGLAGGGKVDFAALEHKRFLGRTARRAGERGGARASLHALAGPALPLVVERWASGARAAVVFTDHADRTDPVALRAVLDGSSAPRPGAPAGGFLGHGVKLTKSFFVRAQRGGLEGDPEARALADRLRAAGSEVASHSISGGPDDRAAVRAGLETLTRLGVVTWIDHEPYTNCEAISSEGWRAEGRYGIRDLLALAGFRWLWEAGDLGGFRAAELVDLFSARRQDEPDPAIYPLPFDQRLWVFQSTMFYAPPAEMAAAISEAALDRLEARRGLFVGHTYLAPSPRTTSRPEHRARLVVREAPDGALVIDPAFDAALARIGRRAREGRVASLTWAEAGDRLRALDEVVVSYLPGGEARVENRGAQPLLGLTVAAPAPGVLEVEGAALAGRDGEGARARAWFDLAPGASAVVRLRSGGAPRAFLPPRPGATLGP
jgi:hypothetical protein